MVYDNKEKKPILPNTNEPTKQQESCWYFMLLCPLICLAIFDTILVSIINQQYEEQYELGNHINNILEPFIIYDKININCTMDEPCNITCNEYSTKTDKELDNCKFSYILLCICILVLAFCNCPVLCKLIEISCDYICYHCFNKEQKHQKIQQGVV